jgi:tetratricopeptide (TPR) repeat protein
MLRVVGRLDEARELLEPYQATSDSDAGTVERAEALAELAAVLMFGGSLDEAAPPLEEAATTLELEQSWVALADVLVTRAVYLILRHRREEAGAVMEHALRLGEREGVSTIVLRCRFNLAANVLNQDGFEQALEEVERGLAFARERGDRSWERALQAQMVAPLVALGRWEAVDKIAATLLGGPSDADSLQAAGFIAQLAAARGDEPTLERCSAVAAEHRESTHVDARASAALVLARGAIERDNPKQALAVITGTLREQVSGTEALEEAYALAIEAAMASQDEAAVSQLEGFVADLPRARTTPLLRAGRARLAAERAHRRGDEPEAERHEENAIALLRSVGARPLLAKALVERAQRRADPDALAEAREIYADLGATRWLERIDQRSEVAPAVTAQ